MGISRFSMRSGRPWQRAFRMLVSCGAHAGSDPDTVEGDKRGRTAGWFSAAAAGPHLFPARFGAAV